MDLRSELTIAVSEVQQAVPVTVLSVAGRINLSNSADLERVALEHVERGMTHALLDLSGVPSITSAGLRAIQLIYRQLEPQQRGEPGPSARLKIYAPSPQVRQVLATAGFDSYIPVFDDRAAAIESFGAVDAAERAGG
jgi:anti-anti-sigma factor